MAEINKLDVGKALDKLRGAETPKARMAQLDDKIGALEEETRRMRAMSHQVERSQRAASPGHDAQAAKTRGIVTSKTLWITIGIAVVVLLLALVALL